jgi:hypothetical protein
MREPVTEEDFRFITTELTRQSEGLEPALEARLDRARRQAIERGLARRASAFTIPLMGRLTLAGAGAALALLLTISLHREPSAPAPVAQEVEEFEMMTNHDQMEVVEDQEFYRWLMEHESVTIRGDV